MKSFYIKAILITIAFIHLSSILLGQNTQWVQTDNFYVKSSQEISHFNAQEISKITHNAYLVSKTKIAGIAVDSIIYTSPIWKNPFSKEMYAIDNTILLYGVQDLSSLIAGSNLATNIISVDSIPGVPTIYTLSLRNLSYEQIESSCKTLMASKSCQIAEPNYFILNAPQDDISPDPSGNEYYSYQWGLQDIENYQYGINVRDAWRISTGMNTKVAVIDTGFELTHPDLINNILTSADCTDGADGATNGAYAITVDSHGTQCAGVVGATNNNIGIVGVAPGCQLILLRRGYTVILNNDTVFITYTDWHITALRLAYQLGADVISNSWSISAPTNNYTIFDAVLEEAYTLGRSGKGCVIIFSTGNRYRDFIHYPSNSPYTISVGAMDYFGERALFSNYGANLDVVAPGENIMTTQIIPKGSYCASSGTSFAAPMVAGIAALILSICPNLTNLEVGNLIKMTAYKLPDYNFDSIAPNGSWNNEVGYGLVDAYKAVRKAQLSKIKIEGTHYLCDSTYQYVRNVPEGASIHWSISPSQGTVIRFGILGDNNKDSVLIGDVMAIPRGNGGNDSTQSRVFPSTPFDPPFPPFPPLITTDSTRTLSVTVSHSGVSYTTQKILYHPNFYGTPQIWASDSATAWTLREWRRFAIQNCQEVPDSLLRWEIYLVRSASDSLVYAKTGRTMKYRPFRGGIYYVIAYNDDNVCGTASSSKTYSVSPSPLDALGNEDDEISQEQEESKEPSVPSMPQRHIPAPSSSTTKTLRDGQLYILREGKTYTVTGQEVK